MIELNKVRLLRNSFLCVRVPLMLQWDPPCQRRQLSALPWQQGPQRGWRCGAWAPVTFLVSLLKNTSLRSTPMVRKTLNKNLSTILQQVAHPTCVLLSKRVSSASLAGRRLCNGPWIGRLQSQAAVTMVWYLLSWMRTRRMTLSDSRHFILNAYSWRWTPSPDPWGRSPPLPPTRLDP